MTDATEIKWVQLFPGARNGSNSDHLTSVRCERETGSGFGTSPSA